MWELRIVAAAALITIACEEPAPERSRGAQEPRAQAAAEREAPDPHTVVASPPGVERCAFAGEEELGRCLSNEHREVLQKAADDGASFAEVPSATIKAGRVETVARGDTKLMAVSFQLAETLPQGRSSTCVAVLQSGVRGGLLRMRYCGLAGEPTHEFKDIVGDATPELLVWIKTTTGEDTLGLKIYAVNPSGGQWRRVLANVPRCDPARGRTEFVAERDQVEFFCRRGDARDPHLTYRYGQALFIRRGDAVEGHLDGVLDPGRSDAQALTSLTAALALPPGDHRHHSLLSVGRERAETLDETGAPARAAEFYVALADMADAMPPAEARGSLWRRQRIEMRYEAARLYAGLGEKAKAIAQLQRIPEDARPAFVRRAAHNPEDLAALADEPAYTAWAK